MTEETHEFDNDVSHKSFAELDGEVLIVELQRELHPPRLNETLSFGPIHMTRWRAMTISALLFAVVTIWAVWSTNQNANRIEQESKQRRADVCASVQQGFDAVNRLVDRIVVPPPNADGTPRVLSTEQQARINEIQRIADEELHTEQQCAPPPD